MNNEVNAEAPSDHGESLSPSRQPSIKDDESEEENIPADYEVIQHQIQHENGQQTSGGGHPLSDNETSHGPHLDEPEIEEYHHYRSRTTHPHQAFVQDYSEDGSGTPEISSSSDEESWDYEAGVIDPFGASSDKSSHHDHSYSSGGTSRSRTQAYGHRNTRPRHHTLPPRPRLPRPWQGSQSQSRYSFADHTSNFPPRAPPTESLDSGDLSYPNIPYPSAPSVPYEARSQAGFSNYFHPQNQFSYHPPRQPVFPHHSSFRPDLSYYSPDQYTGYRNPFSPQPHPDFSYYSPPQPRFSNYYSPPNGYPPYGAYQPYYAVPPPPPSTDPPPTPPGDQGSSTTAPKYHDTKPATKENNTTLAEGNETSQKPADPHSTYGFLESIGLSKRFPLASVSTKALDLKANIVWTQDKTYLPENTTTELRIIRNVEFSTYMASQDKVTLTCANGPASQDADFSKQADTMRWM